MYTPRLIAFDLDGTALNAESRLSKRTREVLEWAAREGVYLIAASGRAYTSLPEDVMALKGLTYAITSNGAAVYEPRSGERVFACPMEEKKVMELLECLEKQPETAIEVFWQGNPHAARSFLEDPASFGVPERAVSYLKRTRTPEEDILSFVKGHRRELDALDIICQDTRHKEQWLEKLETLGGLYVTSSTTYRLETSNREGGKGAALREMAARLNVRSEEIIAFGNADNDVDMLRFAGLGVAVADSPDSVKRQADRIAPASTEDGVAQVLEEILSKS